MTLDFNDKRYSKEMLSGKVCQPNGRQQRHVNMFVAMEAKRILRRSPENGLLKGDNN